MNSEKKERRQEQLAKKAETIKAFASHIKMKNATELTIDGHPYRLISNYREGFNIEKLEERFSSILTKYDYILGDWGYDQLRLRGFYASNSKQGSSGQNIDHIQDYLDEYCNFGCAYFILQNLGESKPGRKPRRNNKRGYHSTDKRNDTGEKMYRSRRRNPKHKNYKTKRSRDNKTNRGFTIRQK